MTLDNIEKALDKLVDQPLPPNVPTGVIAERAHLLLGLAEGVLEQWIYARNGEPGDEAREGFRLLGLHRQGVKGEPSFNACRETCREVVYRYNLLTAFPPVESVADLHAQLTMMTLLVRHLELFVSGKLQEAGLGEFCCASRPIRSGEH